MSCDDPANTCAKLRSQHGLRRELEVDRTNNNPDPSIGGHAGIHFGFDNMFSFLQCIMATELQQITMVAVCAQCKIGRNASSLIE